MKLTSSVGKKQADGKQVSQRMENAKSLRTKPAADSQVMKRPSSAVAAPIVSLDSHRSAASRRRYVKKGPPKPARRRIEYDPKRAKFVRIDPAPILIHSPHKEKTNQSTLPINVVDLR